MFLALKKALINLAIAQTHFTNVSLGFGIGYCVPERLEVNLFERETKDILIHYAKTFIGKPYLWGGNGVTGFDCSGFVQEILKCVGLDPRGDQTAQGLYNYFVKHSKGSGVAPASLLFWGKSTDRITHVSLAIDYFYHIEAGGGNSKTINKEVAEKQGAMVRIRPLNSRKDLIAAIKI